jgi:hypothetical protein
MDPAKRWSCEQLLEHPYFDNFSIETKRDDNKSKAFNQYQNDRKTKQPGVSYFFTILFFLKICY